MREDRAPFLISGLGLAVLTLVLDQAHKWYMLQIVKIQRGQEIYVVGHILKDGTVKGGTGWGAEFAKLCNKPLFVFDQEADRWHRWTGEAWTPASAPATTSGKRPRR